MLFTNRQTTVKTLPLKHVVKVTRTLRRCVSGSVKTG